MPTLARPFRSVSQLKTIRATGDPRITGFGFGSAFLFLIVFIDALVHSRASYDLWAIQTIQKWNMPWRDTILPNVEHLTDSKGAVLAWVVVLSAFMVVRRWRWACVVALVPIGGAVNLAFSAVVTRARPHVDELMRSSLNPEERSFPSGHVMGAVMLYGLVFVAAGELRQPVLRLLVRGACLSVIVTAGLQRLWVGAHWPSDVIGGYALGGLLLASLLLCQEYLAAGITSPIWQSVKEALRTKLAPFRAGQRSE